MKVREVSYTLISITALLIGWGIITTSYEIIAVSIAPLLFLAVPYHVSVKLRDARISGGEFVGDVFEVKIVMDASGFGIVKAMHRIPEHFMVEGKNVAASFVLGKSELVISYRARALRRGRYKLKDVVLEIEHPFLAWRFVRKMEVDLTLDVRQKLRKIKKVETLRGVAKSPMPDVDVAKIGVPGTDFREIRDYVPGDPMKFVNWKATARRGKLMVNQYEVEGKKAVWIFLDANSYMAFGRSVRNYLECGIEIANALAYYFISRGHKVGLYVLGHGICLHPDVGKRQFRRIGEELMRLEIGNETLEEAFEKCKKLLAIYKPLVILITRPEYSNPKRFSSEIIKLGIPIQIIALRGKMEGDEFALKLFEIMRKSALKGLRNVVEWDIERPTTKLIARVVR